MNIFNVHVNRIPCSGRVSELRYIPGSFMPADRDSASIKNEQNAVVMMTRDGRKIAVVQIAGLVARRIICNLTADQQVTAGQRFGMICFGSRVDLYLPEGTRAAVCTGDRVKAGTSIMGYLPD